jgi:hypothetical protein
MMSLINEIYQRLQEVSPEAILYDNCDDALVGTARLYRDEQWVEVAVYSYEELVQSFKKEYLKDDGITDDEAEEQAMEWVDYNVAGGYLGIYTPLIISS